MFKHWHSLCDVKWVSLPFVKTKIHKQNAKMVFITMSGRQEKGDSKKKMQHNEMKEYTYMLH